MFVQFRHVEASEIFYHLPSLLGVQYKKVNHNRGRVIGNNCVPYKGKQLFRKFKPNDIVLTTVEKNPLNSWMEVK